jgi:hypothetical protein
MLLLVEKKLSHFIKLYKAQKVHYTDHNSPTPDIVLSQSHPVHVPAAPSLEV